MDYKILDQDAGNMLTALQVAYEQGLSRFLIRGAIHNHAIPHREGIARASRIPLETC